MIRSLIRLVISFSHKLRDDNVNALSAHAAFFIMISFFPFAMFLLTLIQFIPFSGTALPALSRQLFPAAVADFVGSILSELSVTASGTVLSVTVIAALWSASRGFLAMIRGLNTIYGIRETRNYFLIRVWSAIYTLIFALLLMIVMIIFVFGNRITAFLVSKFPELADYALLVISVRTVVGIGVLLFFFLLIFICVPNRKTRILAELPGALLAAAGWVCFSFLYSYYIDNMGNYSATYGSLTAIVLSMLWLYVCMYLLFFGAEVNMVLHNPVVSELLRKLLPRRKKKRI